MVSIALATYNGERFLKEQLDSILNQTYTDIVYDCCYIKPFNKAHVLLKLWKMFIKNFAEFFHKFQ